MLRLWFSKKHWCIEIQGVDKKQGRRGWKKQKESGIVKGEQEREMEWESDRERKREKEGEKLRKRESESRRRKKGREGKRERHVLYVPVLPGISLTVVLSGYDVLEQLPSSHPVNKSETSSLTNHSSSSAFRSVRSEAPLAPACYTRTPVTLGNPTLSHPLILSASCYHGN